MTDMHGSTALLEAVKNGHEDTMNLLFENGARLCMPESLAASVLCQAVFDGDILLLKRLIRAGIQVDAADYDKRTAAHIAAAEGEEELIQIGSLSNFLEISHPRFSLLGFVGNVAAIRVLAENGADLTLEDRWRNTVMDEAKRSNARQLLEYLDKK